VFDTDLPYGSIQQWFPERSELVDLTRTGDLVRMLDRMIQEPDNNYVVDLQAPLLDPFFTIFHDISFDEGAAQSGSGVAVFFVLDRSMRSIEAAARTRARLKNSEFVIVKNEAIGTVLHEPKAAELYLAIAKDREISLPRLTQEARDYIERNGFSFAEFVAGRSEEAPVAIRFELWAFLETIYNQRRAGAGGVTLLT
jgi:hypothetical protein